MPTNDNIGLSSPITRFFTPSFTDRGLMNSPMLFQSFFGNPLGGGLTVFIPNDYEVEIQSQRTGYRSAPLVQREGAESIGDLEKIGVSDQYTFQKFQIPLAQERGVVTAANISRRIFGESDGTGKFSKTARLQRLASIQFQQNISNIVTRYEYIARQAVLQSTGTVVDRDNNVISFPRDPDNFVTASQDWSDTSAHQMKDVDKACRAVKKNSGLRPDVLMLGIDAYDAWISSDKFYSDTDNRRAILAAIDANYPIPSHLTRFISGGWDLVGQVFTSGGYRLHVMIANSEFHFRGTSTSEFDMPSDGVLVCSAYSRLDRYYGAYNTLPKTAEDERKEQALFGLSGIAYGEIPLSAQDGSGFVEGRMFEHRAYETVDLKTIVLQTQSAPLLYPVDGNAFATVTGIFPAP